MPRKNIDWPREIAEYRKSRETQAEFCRARGLALSTLSLKLRTLSTTGTFVRVGSSERVELELRDGTLLRVSEESLPGVLRALRLNASA